MRNSGPPARRVSACTTFTSGSVRTSETGKETSSPRCSACARARRLRPFRRFTNRRRPAVPTVRPTSTLPRRFAPSSTPRLFGALRATSNWRSEGRAATRKLAARPIDVDLLVYDGTVVQPQLEMRPYNVVPLAEIAPQLVAAQADGSVRRRERGLRFDTDRQSKRRRSGSRSTASASRACGASCISKSTGDARVYNGEFTMVADLAPDKTGVHMSRFAEILEEATLDVLARDSKPARIERLAEAIAREIVRSQRAIRADVRLRAEFGLERWTPVSGKRGEETYTLVGIAHADQTGTRRVVGVEAEGMTACPCAQAMVREHSLAELQDCRIQRSRSARALDALPVATHNQRGRGAILLGVDEAGADEIRAEDLVEIVENSMSSETYDLLKRPDEFFVVNKAHHNPKFVEDVVRGILARALDMYCGPRRRNVCLREPSQRRVDPQARCLRRRVRTFRRTARGAANRLARYDEDRLSGVAAHPPLARSA